MVTRKGFYTPDHTKGATMVSNTKEHNSVLKPFEVGNTNWQTNSEKHQKNLDNGEDLDDVQRHHVDRLVEQRLRNSQASSGFYLELVSVQRQSHDSRVISHQDRIGLGTTSMFRFVEWHKSPPIC